MKKRLIAGLFAHVDAGKTTLAERLLYMNGTVRHFGRIDSKDTFLDTDELERQRGITMYSKQARFTYQDTEYVLVDTPGHSDLTPETERAMWVIDCAVLIISAQEGVTSHTKRLWKLLDEAGIPVFLFINKTDMPGIAKDELLAEIKSRLSSSVSLYERDNKDAFFEEAALTSEELLDRYLEGENPADEEIRGQIAGRKLFCCCMGSALTGEGVEEFLECLSSYHPEPVYGPDFGARIYKISRDYKGSRLVWMKITGGSLSVKDLVNENEKADEIRIYNGEDYVQSREAEAGDICAVKGPAGFAAGDAAGAEMCSNTLKSVPVLSYDVIPNDPALFRELKEAVDVLSEEEPALRSSAADAFDGSRVSVSVSGRIQLDILQSTLLERFGIAVTFKEQDIVYRETITNRVTGVGHFEPLRHYAEVHVCLEPAEKGSGILIANRCSRDDLEPHWQKLILSFLYEKRFRGVLTGSELTDIKITLMRGRAHVKHTESGDFRQAVFRAVRQGLMEAESILLEPVIRFTLEIPSAAIGKALSDLAAFGAESQPPEIDNETAVIRGTCPAAAIRNYQKEVTAYTSGHGALEMVFDGYAPCHNAEEIIQQTGYDPERDVDEPASSVFCSHGAGIIVPWYEVKERMHLEEADLSGDENDFEDEDFYESRPVVRSRTESEMSFAEREAAFAAGEIELNNIFNKTFRKNEALRAKYRRRKADLSELRPEGAHRKNPPKKDKDEILIVDGYNIIFAWKALNRLAADNIDSARDALMDILSNYQGTRSGKLIVVFDAYKVPGRKGESSSYHNIEVVYTGEGETADKYIERIVNEKGRTHNIRVATSDALEQTIVLGNGAARMPAPELLEEITKVSRDIRDTYQAPVIRDRVNLLDDLPDEIRKKLDELGE